MPEFTVDPRAHRTDFQPAVVTERTADGTATVSFAHVTVEDSGALRWMQYDGRQGYIANWRWADVQFTRTQEIRPAGEPEDYSTQRVHPDDWNLLPAEVRDEYPTPTHGLDDDPQVVA